MVAVSVDGGGVLAATLRARAGEHPDVIVTSDQAAAEVCIAAGGRPAPVDLPLVVPSVRQSTAAGPGDVTVAGFWGGLGSLLAATAVAEADDPREVHVAYGFPGARRLVRRASRGLRDDLVGVATDEAVAKVDGALVPEPLGEGRRLAWFPKPVGPAHAVAAGGLEHRVDLGVPTVRTWIASRALTAELLQAIGRLDPATGVGAWLRQRAQAGGGVAGATSDVRWAVVVECRNADGGIVRAWANGTDPVAAAADLLLIAAGRVAAGHMAADGTVAGLGDVRGQLDAAADRRALRWSVSRPEPSQR